ncbi:hypothetical protein KA531_00225 [Candidatus Saccharibacteria bacterium]|nr:hypothetical protein [Candidatus Saccharibacteria bacterium]
MTNPSAISLGLLDIIAAVTFCQYGIKIIRFGLTSLYHNNVSQDDEMRKDNNYSPECAVWS